MKTNLIKILALGAVVVSLGACQKKKAKVVEINELLEINADSKKWELEGQLVKVEHLVLQGFYGNTYIGGAAVGDYVSDLRGVEIQVKKAPQFERNFGYGADITAEGRVVDVNGRLTLQEAKITVNSERPEDGKYKEGEGGLPIYSCPPAATTRSTLDSTLSGRIYSGILVEGVYQLASVPAAINESSPASSFSVVFPGEDLDLTDAENYSPIVVNVPAGSELTPGAITAFNEFFAERKAGDFTTICTTFQYDLEKNGGMGMVLESFWSQKGLEETAKKDQPVIFSSWKDVMDDQGGYYDGGFVDLTKASDEEAALESPFSYLVDESYLSNPKGMWQEAYVKQIIKISDDDLKKCASSVVTVNVKSSKMEAYLDAVEAKLKAAGYVLDESMAENGLYLFTLSDAEVVKKEVVLMINNESQVEYQYIAPKAALDYATFAEFKAGLEEKASAKLSELAGSPVTHTSALVAFADDKKPSNFNLSWMLVDLLTAELDEEFAGAVAPYYSAEFTFDSKEAASAAMDDYKAKLVAAGFVMKKLDLSAIGYQNFSGLFNATSKEFVMLGSEEKNGFADIIILNDVTVTNCIKDLPQSDAELSAAYVAEFNEDVGYGYGLGTSQLPSSFTLGSNAANYWDFGVSYYYSSAGLIQVGLELRYDVELTNEIAANFVTALTTAGFAAATLDLSPIGISAQVTGYFNSASYEFVYLTYEGNTLNVNVFIIAKTADDYYHFITAA